MAMLPSVTGPGHLHKYSDLNVTRSLVQYKGLKKGKPKGRPLFESQSNPYQFDIPYKNRTENARNVVVEKNENAVTVRLCGSETPRGRMTLSALGAARIVEDAGSLTGREWLSPVSLVSDAGFQENEVGSHMAGAPKGNILQAGPQITGPSNSNFFQASKDRNVIRSMPNSMPGYQGFVPGYSSQNVHECVFAKATLLSARKRRGSGQDHSVVGSTPLPTAWSP